MSEDLNAAGDDAVQRAGGKGSGSTSAAERTRQYLLELARRRGALQYAALVAAKPVTTDIGDYWYLPPDSGGFTYHEAELFMAEVWPEGARNYSKIGPRNRNLMKAGQIVPVIYGTPIAPIYVVRQHPEHNRPCQVYVLAEHGVGVITPDLLTTEMRTTRQRMRKLAEQDPRLLAQFLALVQVEAERLAKEFTDDDEE